MKKFWKILIICAVALGVMAVTCPGKQRHVDAEVKFMRKTLHEQAEKLVKDFGQVMEMGDEEKQMIAYCYKKRGISEMTQVSDTFVSFLFAIREGGN